MAPGDGPNYVGSPLSINTTATQFLVLDVDYSSGTSTTFNLYVNPTVGAPLTGPAAISISSTSLVSFDRIRLEDRNFGIDEIRIGTSYSDITAVPEPTTTAVAIAAVCVGLIFIRRRKLSH